MSNIINKYIKLYLNNLNESSYPQPSPVFVHIAGASGSGKTTLLDTIKRHFPFIVTKDLDEIDEKAEVISNLKNKEKKDWTNEDSKKHLLNRQKLLNKFIKENVDKYIVLAGYHFEGGGRYPMNVHAEHKFMLDTDAATSAYRAYLRTQTIDSEFKRYRTEIEDDKSDNQKDLNSLRKSGYKLMTFEDIFYWISNNIDKDYADIDNI